MTRKWLLLESFNPHIIQSHGKHKFCYKLFSFNLTVEHLEMYKFLLQNYLRFSKHTGYYNKVLAQKWLFLKISDFKCKGLRKTFFESPFNLILTVEHWKVNIFLILNLYAQSELSQTVCNKWGMQDFTKWKSSEDKLYIQNKTWSKKYAMKY